MPALPPPPPIPLAGLTPSDGSLTEQDNSPNQPLSLSSDQLSKLGISDVQPGDNVLATVRVQIGGTPDAPSAQITAAGDVRPDDGSSDLVSLSDQAQGAPGDAGLPLDLSGGGPEAGSPDDAIQSTIGAAPDELSKKGTTALGSGTSPSPEDAETKLLGFKRPKGKSTFPSAKEALGDA